MTLSRLPLPALALAALVAGGVAALGFAPWDLWLLTFLGAGVLAALVDTAVSRRRALLLGWLFGIGHFCVGLTWIAKAFTFQAKMPASLGWVAVVGLAMFLALYVALAAGLARGLARGSAARVLVLAAAWMLGEWLRGWVLTGFAWDPLGAAWVTVPGVRQLAQFGGALALSGVAMLVGGGLWLIVRPGAVVAERLLGAGLGVAVAIAGYAATSLNRPHYYPDSPTVYLVQPDIGLAGRELPGRDEAQFQTYLDMTAAALRPAGDDALAEQAPVAASGAPGGDPTAPVLPDAPGTLGLGEAPVTPPAAEFARSSGTDRRPALIVWAESAVPYAVEEDAQARARLASVLAPGDLLLFGGIAVVRDGAGGIKAVTNSLFVIDAKGVLRGRYDKAHLVPLGEYVPARPLMEAIGVARLAAGSIDFDPGPGPRTLKLPGFPPVGVQICYEIIFPGAVIDAADRPAWIVTVSNDAWFGPTGPPQHLAQAKLRAIEEGLPIVRATPTGISAIIDAHGNYFAVQGPGVRGVSSAPLPPPQPATLFARFGHRTSAVFGALLFGIGLAVDAGSRARRRN